MINAQGSDRKRTDPFAQPSISHNSTAVPCQRMSGTARSGNSADRRQTCALQPGLQVFPQILFAAKQMWHTRDVSHKTIGTITCDHRRVAAGPTAQADKGRRFMR